MSNSSASLEKELRKISKKLGNVARIWPDPKDSTGEKFFWTLQKENDIPPDLPLTMFQGEVPHTIAIIVDRPNTHNMKPFLHYSVAVNASGTPIKKCLTLTTHQIPLRRSSTPNFWPSTAVRDPVSFSGACGCVELENVSAALNALP